MKMPLGMEVGFGPGDIVLDGNPAPPSQKGAQQPPLSGPCLLWPNDRPSQQLLSTCVCKTQDKSSTNNSVVQTIQYET